MVIAANVSDNTGGIAVADRARPKSARLAKLWCDAGFKTTFAKHCRARHLAVEVVNRIHPHAFVVLPRRWVVERTWSWLMNNRRLQIDYERDPVVHEGFIYGPLTADTSYAASPPHDHATRAGQTFATATR